jgi:hypothetical protein
MTNENTTNLKPRIWIDAKPIRAALHCAADSKEIRTYLAGVYIKFKDAPAGVKATVAGCNGHILFVALAGAWSHSDDNAPKEWAGAALIIPLDVIKKLDKKADEFEIEQLSANVYKLGGIVFEPSEGTYPDISRVIPSNEQLSAREIKPALYNPDLIVRAQRALQAHYGTKPNAVFQFAQYGDDCGIMHMGENSAQVVIMPMRANGVNGSETVQPFNRDYL